MKKLLLPILFLLLVLPAMSQNLVSISGTVTDLATGNPISNPGVTIKHDSSGGWVYYQTVYTNNNGFYNDTVSVPLNTQGILYVRTIDCQNYMHQVVLTFTPPILNLSADFSICYNSNPCQASFTANQTLPLTVQFTDASIGGGTLRQWAFGDGATSSQMNPVHTYSLPGYYNASLTIGALGTTCYNVITQTIYVWDSIGGGGCQAAFYVVPDSMNTLNTYHFFDQSSGNIISWLWNFGDPASGVYNTSTLQNPIHTYSQPGNYYACLTIHGLDSTCFDVTCDTIVVGGSGGCHAEFTYYADSMNTTNTLHFIDQSVAGTGSIATYFWNFGDGQVMTVTFPGNPNVDHTYALPGTYTVCLTIQGTDSTCYDMTCQTLVVGPPPICHAAFTYYADSVSSSSLIIHFVDQSTGNIVSWNWNFGDGTSSTEQNPVHTYAGPSYYPVTLTVSSPNQWCFDVITHNVPVGIDPGCQASFNYSTNPASGSHVIYFNDMSSGFLNSWSWGFGDGTGSSEQNPVHTYAAAGTYTVCLTVTGNNCTSTFCQNVIIQDSVNYHQIYGQVFAGNFPISMGIAMIFSIDTTGNFTPFTEVFPIDSNGVYYFTMVPDGNYYILAIPINTAGYLPTYYGNTISWELATLINLGTPNNPYNINLEQSDQMTPGPGSASGQINMGDVSSAMTDKINMILMNALGNPIGFTSVSASGAFSFPSLAYGTYYLHPEMPGVTSDVIMITLTAEKPHADIVMTFSGNKILGIRDEVTLANSWSVYPNPVIDNLTVAIDMKQGTKTEISIYNMTGEMVANTMVTLNEGTNTLGVSTASLPSGIYSLRIQSNKGLILTTKLVKIR